jgi:AcrR family transcriptional regulator
MDGVTREQQALETRRRIVEATARVFESEGLAATTTRRIAREVGCADGTLYVHFSNRVELLLGMLERTIPSFLEPMRTLRRRVGRRDVSANLEAAVSAALRLYDRGGPIWGALFSDRELLAAYRIELGRRGFGPHVPRNAIAEYVREEQKIGRIEPSVSPIAVAGALLGAVFQRAFASHFLGEARPLSEDKRFVHELVAVVLGSSTAGKGRARRGARVPTKLASGHPTGSRL